MNLAEGPDPLLSVSGRKREVGGNRHSLSCSSYPGNQTFETQCVPRRQTLNYFMKKSAQPTPPSHRRVCIRRHLFLWDRLGSKLERPRAARKFWTFLDKDRIEPTIILLKGRDQGPKMSTQHLRALGTGPESGGVPNKIRGPRPNRPNHNIVSDLSP